MDINKFDNDTFNFMKNKSYPNLPVNELVDLPIFYINLDRSKDRFELFNNQIQKYNINPNQVTRISAVDGKTLDLSSVPYKIHKDSQNNRPVIACMLSHFKAIKEAYESHHPYAVIMEDDCNFEYVPFQRYKLSDIANFLGETYNIIQLATMQDTNNKLLKISPNLTSPGYKDSTAAYIINRVGMKNIVDSLLDVNTELYVADITIYKLAKPTCYLTKPYFIYFHSTKMYSNIQLLRNLTYEDNNKEFWDNYYFQSNVDNDTFNFMKNKSHPNLPVNELVDLPIFYINLDRSQDRFELFNNQIKKYNINPNQVTRISAVDGKTLDLSSVPYKIHKDSQNNRPVIACMLSHFKAIKEAYESHHPYAVIMEDDCNFEYVPFQRYKLSDIANFLGETYNVMQLATTGSNDENKKLQMSPKFIIPGYKDSTVAYIISRIGMKNILDTVRDSNTELHVADVTIYKLAKQSCYLTKPYFIYFNSTIINTTGR